MLKGYLIVINLFALILMAWDKYKAIKGYWRIREDYFLILTLLGGGIGVTGGVYLFRHKTRHLKFTVLIPLLTLIMMALAGYLA